MFYIVHDCFIVAKCGGNLEPPREKKIGLKKLVHVVWKSEVTNNSVHVEQKERVKTFTCSSNKIIIRDFENLKFH